MFIYPSRNVLHVEHPMVYIASDIYTRYKHHKGFNILHPMVYDSLGLPVEQYAIQTGQHPATTTLDNIEVYRAQLDKIGFSFDWSREVRTSDSSYFKWKHGIFKKLFHSWSDNQPDKEKAIADQVAIFEKDGKETLRQVCKKNKRTFMAEDGKTFS